MHSYLTISLYFLTPMVILYFRFQYIVILVFIYSLPLTFHLFFASGAQAMAAQDRERSNGWPLGLQIMNTRLGLQERLQGAEPYSLHIPSSSFSSFSSSNLDTESSESFFQDSSVPLGKLIGLRADERGPSYLQSNRQLQVRSACNCKDVPGGICIPLILGALLKITRNRMKSKR